MKKGVTELVFILDRSGSMTGLEEETINGYNAMIKRQKKEEGEALITTVLFDHECEMLHERLPLSKVKKMTEQEYYVRGCTALLDAIGSTVSRIASAQRKAKSEERPEKTLVIITTDGLENASREYTFPMVRRLVQKQEENANWEFIFLGANMDAIKVAGQFGIQADHASSYQCDQKGILLNYKVMCDMVTEFRENKGEDSRMDGSWKRRIQERK